MSTIGIKELLEAGVHFGHQTKRWNPKMKPFIFDARNGIHIIDLSKTEAQLNAALEFLASVTRRGGKVLFVGTKKQAQQAVKDTAKETGQMFVTERWLGGTLTNFTTVKTSIKRLKEIEKWEVDGTLSNYGKQEQAMIRREGARLHKYFDGIRDLDKMPAAMFIVDVKREHNAVSEAKKLNIPVVALWIPTVIPKMRIIRSPRMTTRSVPCVCSLEPSPRRSRSRARNLNPSAPASRKKPLLPPLRRWKPLPPPRWRPD